MSEGALTGEASKAAAGDVHGRVVGAPAEEFVWITDPERLIGVGAEGVHDGLVGGGQLGRFGFGPGRGEFRDDLAGRDEFRQTRLRAVP